MGRNTWKLWADVLSVVLPLLFVLEFVLSAQQDVGTNADRDRALAALFLCAAGRSAWRIWRRRRD